MTKAVHFAMLLIGVGVSLWLVARVVVWILGIVGPLLFGSLFIIAVFKIAQFLNKSSRIEIIEYRK